MRYLEFNMRPQGPPLAPTYFDGRLRLDELTLVLGANSSGKTALLETLLDTVTNERLEADPLRRVKRRHGQWNASVVVEFDWSEGSLDVEKLLAFTPDDIVPSIRELLWEEEDADVLGVLSRLALWWSTEFALESDYPDPPLVQSAEEMPPLDYFRERIAAGVYEWDVSDAKDRLLLEYPDDDHPYNKFYLQPVAYVPKSEREAVLPPVVTASAEELEPAQLAERLIDSILAAWFDPGELVREYDDAALPPVDPWLDDDTGTRFKPGLVQLITTLEYEVGAILPTFVAAEGAFALQLLEPSRWTTGTRVVAGFQIEGGFRRAEAVGSGSRRWLAICMRLAATKLRQFSISLPDRPNSQTAGFPAWYYGPTPRAMGHSRMGDRSLGSGFDTTAVDRGVDPPLLLVDEPELHLHPDAQHQIGTWLQERFDTGEIAGAVVATHSPALAASVGAATKSVFLTGQRNRTTLTPATDLAEFDRLAQEAGLGREAWLFATRAVLLVEGEHDVEVLQRFFGRVLDRLRVRFLPLRGARNTQRLVDSDFLGRAGFRMFALFDNVRDAAMRSMGSVEELTQEEKIMWSVRRQSERDDITFLPYPEPDILAALPIEAVGRRFGASKLEQLRNTDGYWASEIAAWREETHSKGKRTSFKRWVAEQRLGLATSTDLVSELLGTITPDDQPSPSLREAISTLEAYMADEGLWAALR